ncbi:MAG: bifunctional hydroxymethylpyrimidine kinase/phosphomethylpyrimidine kinase [Candidatus Limnocylindrales bacterium]
MRTMPVALTVAGSDAGGGAGIQADLKTFFAHGVYGLSAVTAVTAQDTLRVHRSDPVASSLVTAQLEAVLADIGADAMKTGMLVNADIVRAVVEAVGRFDLGPRLVVDPVLLASSGDALIDVPGMETLIERLFPLAAVITPNIAEAAVLLGRALVTVDDLEWAARQLVRLGPKAAVVTGGHLDGPAVDGLYDGEQLHHVMGPRIDTTSTHGTGCTFSAAIAAHLALGSDLAPAVVAAKGYVTEAMRAAMPLGRGRGPLAHDHAPKAAIR